MAGLLYKDFAAVRGKRVVLVLSVLTVLYVFLRMIFSGNGHFGDWGIIFDGVAFLGEYSFLWLGSYYINSLGAKIIQSDEKNMIRSYLSSMPLKKETYVASKYIFVLITSYVVFSLYEIGHITCIACMGKTSIKNFSGLIAGFAVPFLCLVLLMSAIELPMFLLFGKAKTIMIKVGLVMFIAFLLLGYLLFGDLKIFEHLDINTLLKWKEAHAFEITLLSILSPVITLGLYYLSYRIAVRLFVKKEDYDE